MVIYDVKSARFFFFFFGSSFVRSLGTVIYSCPAVIQEMVLHVAINVASFLHFKSFHLFFSFVGVAQEMGRNVEKTYTWTKNSHCCTWKKIASYGSPRVPRCLRQPLTGCQCRKSMLTSHTNVWDAGKNFRHWHPSMPTSHTFLWDADVSLPASASS